MTQLTQFATRPVEFLNNRNKLWWYGALLADFGFIFWLVSLNGKLLSKWIDLFHPATILLAGTGLQMTQFVFGIASAVIIGWGIAIMALSTVYTKQIRRYFVISMIGWFIFDSASSLIFGVGGNVVFNLLFLSSALLVGYHVPVEEDRL